MVEINARTLGIYLVSGAKSAVFFINDRSEHMQQTVMPHQPVPALPVDLYYCLSFVQRLGTLYVMNDLASFLFDLIDFICVPILHQYTCIAFLAPASRIKDGLIQNDFFAVYPFYQNGAFLIVAVLQKQCLGHFCFLLFMKLVY